MAWTTPKTWTSLDPLVASEFNTQFRDNLNALRADTEDAKSKLGKTFPAYQNPRMFRAIIGINQGVPITSSTYVIWHAKCKLTFTPKTDEVLFGVQFNMTFTHRDKGTRSFYFGLRKGNSNVSLSHTDVLAGSVGSASDIVKADFNDRNTAFLVSYQVPVSVVRNEEVMISPTVRINSGDSGTTGQLLNPSVMILTALDVGAYAD